MIRAAVLILALCLSTAAQAQTTTNCSAFGGDVTCNTQPNGFAVLGRALAIRRERQRAAEMFGAALQEGRCSDARSIAMQYGDQNDMAMADQCVTPEAREAEQQKALVATVTASVQAGHCDEAKATALAAGRLDIADQALRVCTPTPKP